MQQKIHLECKTQNLSKISKIKAIQQKINKPAISQKE
jgi:hypothetical protein